MVEEVVRALVTRAEELLIDGTVGAGGHAEALLSRGSAKLVGIDRDEAVLKIATKRLEVFHEKFISLHGSYENLERACALLGSPSVDGVLLDLGLSSFQMDSAERGFSFSREAALDMRMDANDSVTAADLLQRSSQKELEKIFRDYGEESFASRIAATVVEERRRHHQLETTTEFANLVSRVIPRKAWPRRIHPATRVFQGLRIAVNHELERLDKFLEKIPSFLSPGGRVAILSYHSLEDRRVKTAFRSLEDRGVMKRLTKKPLRPTEEEIEKNPRARSAKLRVAEKLS